MIDGWVIGGETMSEWIKRAEGDDGYELIARDIRYCNKSNLTLTRTKRTSREEAREIETNGNRRERFERDSEGETSEIKRGGEISTLWRNQEDKHTLKGELTLLD